MSIRLNGATSGSIEIDVPAVAGTDTAITIPAISGGEFIVSDSAGDVNIDSGTLFVDASTNSVGIGTTSPAIAFGGGGGTLDAAGPALARGAINAHQTNAGVLQYNGNVTSIRSYGATAGTGEIRFSTGGGGGSSDTERLTIHSTGYMNAGGFLGSSAYHRINGINATENTAIVNISGYQSSGGSSQDTAYFFSCGDSAQPSSSAAAVKVFRISSTSRSINAAGTINASGADYAEYMFKAGDFTIAKGDVCGINVEGKLTNVFADAISFAVKSTNPSYVGGDTWHLNAGEAPGGYDDDRTEEEIAAAKIVYEQKLEAARQMVDRIAFSGQVPVNVTGATPGQYIVPAETADGGIEGVAKNEADLTLAEYMRAVGKVIAIEDDGRARIIVKVA